ncbi:MAG: glycosyltransferase [Herpetosiphonaceae bacterium]|nr:glycosyltransferase [Herpetosiphonaceae bacterium]
MTKKQTRILHVVGAMNRGGVETWLMHVLRSIDREQFHLDFLVHTVAPGAYDQEIRFLGSSIIPCLHPSKPWIYSRNFQRIIREHGPYHVVHSHVHHYSGLVLRLAYQAGIPVRIAHCHSDTSAMQAQARPARKAYLRLMKLWINLYGTVGLAASELAGTALFASVAGSKPHWQVYHCGIDLGPFYNVVDIKDVRDELGLPPGAFVLGHVGSFSHPKNHAFLVDIAAEVAKREPAMFLLLVGDGALRPAIEQKVASLGLTDQVVFTGQRQDVPRLLRGAMDIFVMPSLYEGLPLVGIEAQAAGLPYILSDVITDEIDEVQPLICRLSLASTPGRWADEILAMRGTSTSFSQSEAVALMERSSFNIKHSIKLLTDIYYDA